MIQKVTKLDPELDPEPEPDPEVTGRVSLKGFVDLLSLPFSDLQQRSLTAKFILSPTFQAFCLFFRSFRF